MQYRNLPYIRNLDPKLHELLSDIITAQQTTAQQTNANTGGQPAAPPPVNGVKITERGGFAHVSISDENQIYRGIRYYTEHADNPQFTNPQVVPMYDSRNAVVPIGKETRYFRVYSAYSSSPPSAAVYHGSLGQPQAVTGSGVGDGPLYGDAQGSGTGAAGQGLQGPGGIPFRSDTGAPPTRGE